MNDSGSSYLKDFPSRRGEHNFKVFPLKKIVNIYILVIMKTWVLSGNIQPYLKTLQCSSLVITLLLKCLALITFYTVVFLVFSMFDRPSLCCALTDSRLNSNGRFYLILLTAWWSVMDLHLSDIWKNFLNYYNEKPVWWETGNSLVIVPKIELTFGFFFFQMGLELLIFWLQDLTAEVLCLIYFTGCGVVHHFTTSLRRCTKCSV